MANIPTTMQQKPMDGMEIVTAAFQTFLDNTADMIFVKNINLVYVAASQPFAKMVGKSSAQEIVGRTDFEIFESQELAKRYTADDDKLLTENTDLVNYLEPLTDDHGRPRYSSTSKFILRNADGQAIGILGISRDITHEYLSRQRHHQELKYLFELPDDTYAALYMDIDDWRIVRHHRHAVHSHMVTICDTIDEFSQNALRCIIDTGNADVLEFYRTLSKENLLRICNSGTRQFSMTYLRRMPNDEKIWVNVDINFLIDPENGHLCAIWTLRNIDKEKQEEINLLYAAEYDEMTGLLNRAYTTKYIRQALEKNSSSVHALLTIDVDNFKSLNDTYGHQVGDTFLINLADTLKSCFRETDIIGRIGGDEFFILMKNISNIKIVTERAKYLLELTHKLCSPYTELKLSISVGISLYPYDGPDLDTLYSQADKALYKSKKHGKNQFIFASELSI